jgi:hypothetical protein
MREQLGYCDPNCITKCHKEEGGAVACTCYQEGHETGYAEGMHIGQELGYDSGYTEGHSIGIKDLCKIDKEGVDLGYFEQMVDFILSRYTTSPFEAGFVDRAFQRNGLVIKRSK